jgi:predicted GNAT family acetyltransferase
MRVSESVLAPMGVRSVTSSDLDAVRELIARDPVSHCFVDSRIRGGGADPWRLGGDLWGYFTEEGLQSLLYNGANLVPVQTTPQSRAAFADRLRSGHRRCSSFVGPADEVLDLWRLLEPAWGPARAIRDNQPFLVMDCDSHVAVDPGVKAVDVSAVDVLVPACIDMFTDEVGVSPVAGGAGSAYRARVADLVQSGRAFARIEEGRVVFKAEVGTATEAACQIQGVWVARDRRGLGLSEPGMAAVVQLARASIAPVVSLYVNDFNTAARKAYAAVGFEQVGTFATILF